MTKAKRVAKAGFVNFWRNGWVSLATVLIMITTLFVIGSLIFDRAVLMSTLDDIQDKIDISVYFETDAQEAEILTLKESLAKLKEVKNIEYISSEQALTNFKERHKNDALITQSLDELEENPLGAALNIKAQEPSQYANISKFLEDNMKAGGVNSIIDKVNYRQNKVVIDRLSEIISASEKSGAARSIILIIISIIVIFNTIRMAIYGSREEIRVMKLVGASNGFISGPFVIEGIMYGIVSAVATMAIFYPITLQFGTMFLSGPFTSFAFSQINIFDYYISNFAQIFFILLATGIILGAISSIIAVRRYLRA